jgi:hypothetical protein
VQATVSCATGLASMSSPPATAHGGGTGPDKPHGKRLGGASGGKGAAASRGHGGGNGSSGSGEEQCLILAADSADVSKGGPFISPSSPWYRYSKLCFLYAVQAR